jgi:hypothetical protein
LRRPRLRNIPELKALMKAIRTVASLVLATLGASASASVIMPIANSPDGGYTATGAVHSVQSQQSTPMEQSNRMGASAAMPGANARTDVFVTADGSSMGLAGGTVSAAKGEGHEAAVAGREMLPTAVINPTTRGNAE